MSISEIGSSTTSMAAELMNLARGVRKRPEDDEDFAANFVKLGFHPGFGLTYTLPRLIGRQKAALLFYTGRRIKGDEAVEWGLADVLTTQDKVRDEAVKLAREIAENAPLAVMSVRASMRQNVAENVQQQSDHEHKEQSWQRQTEDFNEGIKAVSERRPGNFVGH